MSNKTTFLIAGGGFLIFTILLLANKVSGANYTGLLALTFFTAVVFPNIDRIKELDYQKLKLVFFDIKKVSDDVKKLGKQLAELIAFNNLFAHRWTSEQQFPLISDINKKSVQKTLDYVQDSELNEKVKNIQKLYEEFDSIGGVKGDDPNKEFKQKKQEEIGSEITKNLKEYLSMLSDDKKK